MIPAFSVTEGTDQVVVPVAVPFPPVKEFAQSTDTTPVSSAALIVGAVVTLDRAYGGANVAASANFAVQPFREASAMLAAREPGHEATLDFNLAAIP